MRSGIELLAPAGDWEAFLAAVENGADAVYLGGRLFNARQFAGNFDSDQLKKAIDYAHARGVSIYLAANTLVSDSELGQAVDMVEDAYVSGIDGVIVQDLGFAGLIRDIFPGLNLHASTQMTIYNLEGVKTLEKLGFKRVVLARELSLPEISHISKSCSAEIEIFIHGALCVCYSGQCLMSSIIGGRSGNRGKCAQPCRLPYELVGETSSASLQKADSKGYLLSPKDICSLYDLEKIIGSGVKSLKIEGRMKNPEYVATVVRIYRKYIDRIQEGMKEKDGARTVQIETTDERDLTQIFNRGGFHNGYLAGKSGRDMMCYEKPKNWGVYLGKVISYDRASKLVNLSLEGDLSTGDGVEIWNGESESPGAVVSVIRSGRVNVQSASRGMVVGVGNIEGRISKGNKVYKTSDKRLNEFARESFTGKSLRKVKIEGKIEIKTGTPVMLSVRDNEGNHIEVSGGQIAETAVNRALTRERVVEQAQKTGATPFTFSNIEVKLDENLSVPVSEINNLRRRALEELENKRAGQYHRKMSKSSLDDKERLLHFPGNSRKKEGNLKISVLFYGSENIPDITGLKADRVYLPFADLAGGKNREHIEDLRESGKELFVWLPSITRGNYDAWIGRELGEIIEAGISGVLVGNPAGIGYLKDYPGLRVYGDYSLNTFNSLTAAQWQMLGLKGVTLSYELNIGQINGLNAVNGLEKEVLVYGRIPLMTSEYCPVGSTVGGFKRNSACNKACLKGGFSLKDRKGMEFPVWCDRVDCRSTLFNSNVLFMLESMDKIKSSGVDTVRINITDEKPEEVNLTVNAYKDIIEEGKSALERYKSLIGRIEAKGFTKGHYFRGV